MKEGEGVMWAKSTLAQELWGRENLVIEKNLLP